jgi:hypothetical protein
MAGHDGSRRTRALLECAGQRALMPIDAPAVVIDAVIGVLDSVEH